MTASIRRRRSVARPQLVAMTNHWTLVDGEFRRDCWLRLPDGSTVLRPVREQYLTAAAVAA